MAETKHNPDEAKQSAAASPSRAQHMRLIDVSSHAFPTAEKLSALLRASQAGHRMQSLERAASAAGDLESMLRQNIDAYYQQVIFPLEESPLEQSGGSYYRQSAIEEPITVSFSHIAPISLTDVTVETNVPDGLRILQNGIQVSLGLMFISVFIMLASNAAGLAGLFLGLTAFCFANYASYRVGGRDVIVSPRISLMGIYGGLGLAATMIVAAFA